MMNNLWVLLLSSWVLWCGEACNEAVCGSIVSKCTLLKSCDCEKNESSPDCSCCKTCYACLEHLYDECCSCVGMCKKSDTSGFANVSTNAASSNSRSLSSQVSSLPNPDDSLFDALTAYGDDVHGRWSSYSFPIDVSFSDFHKYPHLTTPSTQETVNFATLNCTVTYLTQCASMNKCKKACESMGGGSYRWFHDSCCQCVKSTCINYGIDESRCAECPEPDNDVDLTPEEIRLLESEFAEEHLLFEEEIERMDELEDEEIIHI
uniref:Protein twisted gastrulationlike [Megachile rotundata] n=1 Tax=Lepeophtheirus salmonis TaxID=72036 RepID=A0A0K2VCF7_LEPSM